MPVAARLLLGLGCIALSGCSSFGEAQEDRRVLLALDALRDAPGGDLSRRRRLLEALERQAATSLLARRARDMCADAYRLLIEGNERAEVVRRALAGSGAAPGAALSDLAAAEEKIKKSEAAMPACEKAAAELRHARR
jgi:hypothetical protein